MAPKKDVKTEEKKEEEVTVAAADAAEKSKKKNKSEAKAESKEEEAKPAEDEEKKGEESKEGGLNQEQLLSVLRRNRLCEDSRRNSDRPHPFWDTQPVPAIGSDFSQSSAAIEEPPTGGKDGVRAEPYPLPDAFEWCSCDVNNDEEAKEVYTLLNENYVEDDDSMFRFDYSIPFLRWALTPPGFLKQWHLGVRVKTSGKLVGFITGIPATMAVYDPVVNMVEINFLCVHKKLRSKRLAPVLIKEITRRVNREGIWQAVYTAGVLLPRPVAECRYFHRSLNPKKLIDVGFSRLGPRMTMSRTIKLYKVPEEPQIPGMRQMQEKDMKAVFELVTNYLKKFPLHPEFKKDELAHWVLPRDGVVYSYVREDPSSGRVTDMCSFYALPSSILQHEKHDRLEAAYSFWNVANTVSMSTLMYDALIYAKQKDFDVFNALDLMDNESFLEELKFGKGDGFLQYYLYNWKCPKISPSGIGLVLL
eukprot:TRINITY_DN2598_c0_g1_i1.p1 TRINITY_DN2598_c0_g1~~TRINITY_DN2598_c0_g1_i1.p1  ORF type:complete len:475 (+),score=176.62 TRINITY_DN2598_c0_g1_i1:110-1534(+)